MTRTFTQLAAVAATCMAVAGGLAIAQTSSSDPNALRSTDTTNPGPAAGPNAGAPADTGATQSGSTATGTSPTNANPSLNSSRMSDGTSTTGTRSTDASNNTNGTNGMDDDRLARRDRN